MKIRNENENYEALKVKTSENCHNARPFLRWAGGKQKLASKLANLSPKDNAYNRYFEPFLGGGSVFFKLKPKSAILGDKNFELINCYRQVKTSVDSVIKKLYRYTKLDSRSFYNRIRSRSTNAMSDDGRAARFIYLNKAAFNGIYRVNLSGKFNVPYGPSHNGIAIPSPQKLREVSNSLSCVKLYEGDFEHVVAKATANDFVYLDPPYPPASATAYFTHYTQNRFSWEDQIRVAAVFKDLASRGCNVMLSNSSHKEIIKLYQDFRKCHLKATRWIGSNGDRYKVHEIVVTSYDPELLRGVDV